MSNSKSASAPKKPRPDFPLTPRTDGRWQKKVRGEVHYFTGTAQEALEEWLRVKDDLLAGHERPSASGETTLHDLCNEFIESRQAKVESGDLAHKTAYFYKRSCRLLLAHFGKGKTVASLRPADFAGYRAALGKTCGPVALGNEIRRCKTLFRFAVKQKLIAELPHYGDEFDRPSAKRLRLEREERGPKLFTPAQIQAMLAAAGPQLRAMIYLGINAGFGPADTGRLPITALDLDAGWVTYARGKTGIGRRVPLWGETVAAIRAVLANRPKPKAPEHAGLVFLTRLGQPWHTDKDTASVKEMRKLLNDLGITQPGLGLYCLRHCLQTIGDQTRDFPAVSALMGHADASVAARYRDHIDDDRLRAVVDHVRGWALKKPAKPKTSGKAKPAVKRPARKAPEKISQESFRIVG